MKFFLTALLVMIPFLALVKGVEAYSYRVRNYYKPSTGSYVYSYSRTSPNYTVRDNYSYYGNYNPYTGSFGRNYYRHSPTSWYYWGY